MVKVKNIKINKKGQLEVLGLTIVIILITLGILFVIKFVILKEPPELRKSYTRTEIASNTLNAILRTDTPCRSKSITELYQDCAAAYPSGSIDCGGGVTSCKYANDTVKLILDGTLKEWGIEHEFVV